MPERMNHEYMPTPGSMAAELFDINSVIKQKYIGITQRNSSTYPYKALHTACGGNDLKSLLELNTNDVLKNMIDTLKADIKKNMKKELIIPLLCNEIVKGFEALPEIMNDSIYNLLLRFRHVQILPLWDFKSHSSFVKYLLQRGYLFRCIYDDNEVLLMPDELLQILDGLDEAKTNFIIERNTAICTIGKGILHYYGVMDEENFLNYLNTMFESLEKGKQNTKIHFAKINYSDYYHVKALHKNIDTLFSNYSLYSEDVNVYYFNGHYYMRFFADHSVFDPCNIYYEQQERDDLDFFPLSCNELMSAKSPDTRAKNAMRNYLVRHLQVNPIKADKIIDEWSCYIKNGEDFRIYINSIISNLNFKSVDKINEMLSFATRYFINNLIQWKIKGHTPNELMGIKPEELDEEGVFNDSIGGHRETWGKTGRNDPCPCGSGKKYKKCCGK